MNEATLNHTAIEEYLTHIGGFVKLECDVDGRRQGREWSAFYARLILPQGCCRHYIDHNGEAVAGFSTYECLRSPNVWRCTQRR